MPIDTSIYGNLQTPQAPNPLQTAQQAMQLGQLGMQQMQMARQLRTQSDIQDAYMRNTDSQTGQLDQQGVLTTLGQRNPMAAQQVGQQFSAQNEAQAKAKTAQADYAQKLNDVVGPTYEYMANSVPADQRAAVWPQMVQHLKDQGLNTDHISPTFNEQDFQQHLATWRGSPLNLANQQTEAKTAEAWANAGPMAQAKLKGEVFGSRSPTESLADAYNKDMGPVKTSQMNMRQMMDSYNNPSPQGDASMLLNAFKIKNPNVPDVNSLEEMRNSQAAGDQFRQAANKALSGGLDKSTRDNIMRDGISAFRANYGTYQDTASKYQQMASDRGVPLGGMTKEPGLDRTYADAMGMQKDLGPYVPPAQRGGISGTVTGAISKVLGIGGPEQTANASGNSTPPKKQATQQAQYRSTGSTVTSDEAAQYAVKHGMKLSDAQKYLKGMGYVIGR